MQDNRPDACDFFEKFRNLKLGVAVVTVDKKYFRTAWYRLCGRVTQFIYPRFSPIQFKFIAY